MLTLAILLVFLFAGEAVRALPTCSLTCDKGSTCFSQLPAAMDCLQSIPFNKLWANTTLDVLMQSLENFGFSALYHSTGPPYSISMDIQGLLAQTLEMVNQDQFPADLDFQEYVQQIFQKTIDAHTRYSKPYCYNVTFLQPFSFDMKVVPDASNPIADEPRLFTMKNIYTQQYKETYPDLSASVDAIIGKEVLLLNGVEFATELSGWGDSHETRSNNRGVRFNAAYRSYLYRSAVSYNIIPIADLTLTLVDGSEYTFPWLALYGYGLADLDYCAAQKKPTLKVQEDKSKLSFIRTPVHEELHPAYQPQYLQVEGLKASNRVVIIPPDDPYQLSCFVQTVASNDASEQAGVEKVLVIKVASFSPPGADYLLAWEQFLDNAKTCLSTDFDMIVVDVMQNGGGYVCLGLRLIELLVEDFENDHTKVQMNYDLPHSKLMDQYIAVVNAPDPYPDAHDVEQILNPATQEPYPDGQAYYYPGRNVTQGGVVNWRTNFFALDCREAESLPANGWRPPKFMPKNKLVILTDGTCGSTCASFTKIPQEADKATFVGAGGLWNENMDVSSYAGGFVCKPDYLQVIANLSHTTFPSFLTYQKWQFAWATWYSKKLPSRQTQFTEQTPAYRQAFWGFPHASIDPSVTTEMISILYDQVIATSIVRVAAANVATSNDDACLFTDSESITLLTLTIIFGVFLLVGISFATYYFYFMTDTRRKSEVKYGMSSESLLHRGQA